MNKDLQGKWALGVRLSAILFALFHIYTAGFGLLLEMKQRSVHLALGLGIALAVNSAVKRSRTERRISTVDLILIGLVLVSCLNVYLSWFRFLNNVGESTTLDLALGIVITLVTLEAGRRTIGIIFPIMTGIFIVYALFGNYFPGIWKHRGFSLTFLLQELYQGYFGIWGPITGVSAGVLAIYMIFGSILMLSGGGSSFVGMAISLVGKYRGGPALTAVLSSASYGTISGVAVANVATTGAFTIPLMKRLGYSPAFAGGVEAAASTGGGIMPPIMAAGAFVMAELLNISYWDVAIAAAIPAVLYYLGVGSGVYFEALRLGLQPIPKEERPPFRSFLRWGSLGPLFVPVLVLISMIMMGFSTILSCFYACMASLAIFIFTDFSLSGILNRLRKIVSGLGGAGIAVAEIVPLMVCASIMICVVNMTGVAITFGNLVMSLAGVSLLLSLILGAAIVLVLGMGLPLLGAYLLGVAIVGPGLFSLGMPPFQTHLFMYYYACFSALTPPVCVSVFTASAIARANWLEIAWVSLRLALVAYFVPFMFMYNSNLLLKGNPLSIAVSFVTACAGSLFLGIALFGYLDRRLNILTRFFVLFGGFLMFLHGWQESIIGFLIIVFAILLRRSVLEMLFQKLKTASKSVL